MVVTAGGNRFTILTRNPRRDHRPCGGEGGHPEALLTAAGLPAATSILEVAQPQPILVQDEAPFVMETQPGKTLFPADLLELLGQPRQHASK